MSTKIQIDLVRKKYGSKGDLSLLSDSDLTRFYNIYRDKLLSGGIFSDYQGTVRHNLEIIEKILIQREKKKKSSSPQEEKLNLLRKINEEQILLQSLELKRKKIQQQEEDLKFKILHQKERLAILENILER